MDREPLLGFVHPTIEAYGAESESAGSSLIAFSDISYVVKQGWSLITKSPSKVVLNRVRLAIWTSVIYLHRGHYCTRGQINLLSFFFFFFFFFFGRKTGMVGVYLAPDPTDAAGDGLHHR